MVRIGRLVAAVVLVVGLTACSPSPPAAPPAAPVHDAAASRPAADLDWSLPTVSGRPFEGKSLLGKPAVLWFWAPWCPSCQSQIAEVRAVAKTYGNRVAVVGIGGMDLIDNIRHGPEVGVPGTTTLVDAPMHVWTALEVTSQATYVVVDDQGRVAYDSGNTLETRSLADAVALVAG